ncbi:MAG: hypothetical protein EAZ91_09645 [Cytophagales bacterium]|nr:MAG: hypothetical protein EAZ91_09645 [Cytophagales bacterium]
MPNYEEVIKQSQANVRALSEKLKDLDKLYADIEGREKKANELPELYNSKFQEIAALSENYATTLGVATKQYLDGNNTLFTSKLSDLTIRTKELEKEISRLIDTDLTKLFVDLQKAFMDRTRADLAIELKRFEKESTGLQSRTGELKKEVERLEQVDLIKHFDKLQRTLADIFGAVNAINLTLTNLVQTLTGIVQSLGTIQTTIDVNHKDAQQRLSSFSEATAKHLADQDKQAAEDTEFLKSKMNTLSEENELIKKELKSNRTIFLVGITIILAALVYIAMKQNGMG